MSSKEIIAMLGVSDIVWTATYAIASNYNFTGFTGMSNRQMMCITFGMTLACLGILLIARSTGD